MPSGSRSLAILLVAADSPERRTPLAFASSPLGARSTTSASSRRAAIEYFGRDLEERGRARATVARRLCTVAGFYRYAVDDEPLEHAPAVPVRRPRLDYESHVTGSIATNSDLCLRPPGSERRGARPHFLARPERTAGLRGDGCRTRGAWSRTRTSKPHHRVQERQGRHDPARPTHGQRGRPHSRRAVRGTGLPRR